MPRAKKTSTNTPSKAAKPLTSTKPPKSKAAFVRSLPSSTPAKEVVAKGKTLGLSLSINYVYNIRGAAKKKRAAAKSQVLSTVPSTRPWSVSQHAETLLRAVAAEIGVARALEVLQGERTRVHSILR